MSFSDPRKIVEELSLTPQMRVADFGSGSGHYALATARKVREGGHVYAIDIQKELLATLKKLATNEGLFNIDVIWGDIDEKGGSKLAPDFVDVVVIANVLFQVEHRRTALEEAMRVLKPGGRLLIVDWKDSFGGLGPTSHDLLLEKDARELSLSVGFMFDRDITDAGDHHYGMVFTKNRDNM